MALFVLVSISIQTVSSIDFDMNSTVVWVQDGDTFKLANEEWIRLADINAPNSTQTGYNASKWYLYDLIFGKTVYLQVDEKIVNNRLICVAYIDYSPTQYLNVNEALLSHGYAWEDNFTDNRFDPSTWTLYVVKSNVQPQPSQLESDYTTLLLVIFIIVAIVIIVSVLYTRSIKK